MSIWKTIRSSIWVVCVSCASGRNPSSQPNLGGPRQQELLSVSNVLSKVREFRATVLFVGFGKQTQFRDPELALEHTDQIVEQLNRKYGAGQWIAIFGGDLFDPTKPDIAHVVKHLSQRHLVPTLAIQSSIIKTQFGGVDPHISFVHYVPTFRIPALDESGRPILKDGIPTSKVHWGGLVDGVPRGPSSVYLGPEFIDGSFALLKHVVAFGGGPIARDEVEFAFRHGIPITFIPTRAKHSDQLRYSDSLSRWAKDHLNDSSSLIPIHSQSDGHSNICPIQFQYFMTGF